jgi:hypothetical protein
LCQEESTGQLIASKLLKTRGKNSRKLGETAAFSTGFQQFVILLCQAERFLGDAEVAKGNERKLEELILYISQKCANDKTFGSIKLNKILCYSDFTFYVYNGHGITDMDYQKLANGPAPRRLVPVRDKMIRKGHLVHRTVSSL